MTLFLIGVDPGRVLFHQSSKDEFLKHRKNQRRQQEIQHRPIGQVSAQPDAEDVEARCAPHQTSEEQQGGAFYFHRIASLIERCSFSRIKNPHATVGIFSLIQGPANDLQHGTWVIILAQQGREDQGKQDIRKFLCGKLLRERIRTNLCIPLQDRTQAR